MVKNSFYVKKVGKVSDFKVWLVNGEKIRKNIDEDFVNFAQHFQKKYIPNNEFWIDRENRKDELHFYIDHMLIEHRLMQKGMSFGKAREIADKRERAERLKSAYVKKLRKKCQHKEDLLKMIHRKLLKKYSTSVKIWLINGEIVRDLFYDEYAEGGHDKVYHFVPSNEVWIDEILSPAEIKFIILHELHERALMAKGMKYLPAHRSATVVEDICRKNPKILESKIKIEMKKNSFV